MTRASKSQRSVTIKDVAKKAETSIATVSYVFSDAERPIRPELRERVLQVAAEIGYVKNAAASSMPIRLVDAAGKIAAWLAGAN